MIPVNRYGDASERLERLIGRGFIIAKVVAYGSLLLSYLSSRNRIPRPAVSGAVVAGAGVQTAVSVVRVIRRRQVIDPTFAHVDVLVATAMIVGEAISWNSRAFPPDPRLGLPHAVTIGAFLPAMLPDRARALRAVALPTIAFIASSSSRTIADPSRTRPSLRVAEACVLPLTSILGHRLISELRFRARQQDEARAAAVETAARISADRERQRQYRQLHDSALQVLETIAGGWEIEDAIMLSRLDEEIAMLDVEISGEGREAGRLHDEVRALVRGFALIGLRVEMTASQSDAPDWLDRPQLDALLGAVRELLNNVVKHAGVDEAELQIMVSADRVTAKVRDRGHGFDPHMVSSGFGLAGSVSSRMVEAGGGAAIRSSPGDGTEVELWLTRS